MSWSSWYALKNYVRSSYWVIPFLAVVFEQITLRILLFLERHIDWFPVWPFSDGATISVLQAIISLVLSFIVFTFGSMLVAIQIASGQLTPRIIATTLLRDNVIRFTVGLFIFSLLLAIAAISRLDLPGPKLTVWAAAALGLVSLSVFLYLIDYAARLLRPVSIVGRVAEEGFKVIASVYPERVKTEEMTPKDRRFRAEPARIVVHSGASAIILAVDLKALVLAAQKSDGVVEFAARIGDFIATGQPLFRLYGGAAKIADRTLRSAVALGTERTIEQDATFAFRVIVDIAIKALSKAINDPTTAVLAIDQLQRLLRTVGERDLHNDLIQDSAGTLRVIFPTPNWEDFVQLSCREIRLYGAENFQIARRLHSMLNNLEESLADSRKPAIRLERDLLDRMIEQVYILPEDMALARIADSQGLGGTTERP